MTDLQTNKPGGVKENVIDFFKNLVGFDLNATLSLADPEIRKTAERLAESTRRRLSSNHWLHTDIAERAIGVLSSRLESAVEGQSKSVRGAIEKLSDFIDAFRSAFYRSGATDTGNRGASSKPSSAQVARDFQELNEKFLERARVRLEKAKGTEEKETVAREIWAESTLLAELKVIMTEGLPQKEPMPEPSIEKVEPKTVEFKEGFDKFTTGVATCLSKGDEKLTQVLQPLNESLTAHVARQKAENERLRQEVTLKESSRLLPNPLGTIFKLVFGFGGKKTKRPKSKKRNEKQLR